MLFPGFALRHPLGLGLLAIRAALLFLSFGGSRSVCKQWFLPFGVNGSVASEFVERRQTGRCP